MKYLRIHFLAYNKIAKKLKTNKKIQPEKLRNSKKKDFFKKTEKSTCIIL